MKENELRNTMHENNSSILSGRAGAGQQLATSYRWFAVFLLVSPSFSVLSLPLSSQLFLALLSSLGQVDSRLRHFHHQLDPVICSHYVFTNMMTPSTVCHVYVTFSTPNFQAIFRIEHLASDIRAFRSLMVRFLSVARFASSILSHFGTPI